MLREMSSVITFKERGFYLKQAHGKWGNVCVCGVAKGYCDGTDVSWTVSAGLDWISRQCEEPDGD